jgi:hypothetical protein
MANNNKIVKKWRGTRKSYNIIVKAGLLDYWTRYSVKDVDGTWTEYYGSNQITCPSGQYLPVLDIVSTLPSVLNPGDRYLVGRDATETESAEYYIVTIDVDDTASNGLSARTDKFNNNSGMSVRVINRKSMAYQLVDGEMTTYDMVDGGVY